MNVEEDEEEEKKKMMQGKVTRSKHDYWSHHPLSIKWSKHILIGPHTQYTSWCEKVSLPSLKFFNTGGVTVQTLHA